MAYDLNSFKEKAKEVEDWLSKELGTVRTGRASLAVLDSVRVDVYGSKTPLQHIANITTEDARSLMVSPWDKSQVKDIEHAISEANLGVSTAPTSLGIRVIFPELTGERRILLGKTVGEKLEQARVSLRKEREAVLGDLDKKVKEKTISEDDKFRAKDDVQKIVDEFMKKFDLHIEKKKREIES